MMNNIYSPANDQANIVRYGVDSGSASAYIVSYNPPCPNGIQATELIFKPINTNTGASTITCNSGTTYAILSLNGSALTGGEIQANGLVKLIFNSVIGAYFIEFSLNSSTVAFNTLTANTPSLANQVAIKSYVDLLSGIGQNWVNGLILPTPRAVNTAYQNTSNNPRLVIIGGSTSASPIYIFVANNPSMSNALQVGYINNSSYVETNTFFVDPGWWYKWEAANGSILFWTERS